MKTATRSAVALTSLLAAGCVPMVGGALLSGAVWDHETFGPPTWEQEFEGNKQAAAECLHERLPDSQIKPDATQGKRTAHRIVVWQPDVGSYAYYLEFRQANEKVLVDAWVPGWSDNGPMIRDTIQRCAEEST